MTSSPVVWLWPWLAAALCATEFPNPQTEWRQCGRPKPSFVCDPDFILDGAEADKLDRLAQEFRRSTSCLCSRCNAGLSVGLFLKHNVTRESLREYKNGRGLAEMLRRRWNLGMCDDDILILLLLQPNVSDFSLGAAVRKILPEKTALQILSECRFHFAFGWYYQGLESVVSSFNDELLRLQRREKIVDKSLVVGIALGTVLFLTLIAAAVAVFCRQVRRRKAFAEDIYDNLSDKHKDLIHDRETASQLQKLTNANSDDDDTENGDPILFQKFGRNADAESILPMGYLNRKRQLSCVEEESCEDGEAVEDGKGPPRQMDIRVLPRAKRSMQVTEL